jgi:hypothetical protein
MLVGIRLTFANGTQVTHGKLEGNNVQAFTLVGDEILEIKVYYTVAIGAIAPRVRGLTLSTKKGYNAAFGHTEGLQSLAMKMPANEEFVGFIGSSGDEIDSLGVATRPR